MLVSSLDMAHFVARGFLRLDAVVPEEINQTFLYALNLPETVRPESPTAHFSELLGREVIPEVAPGTRLSQAYASDSAIGNMLKLPEVAGAIESLVGRDPVFDHHFLHLAFPEAAFRKHPERHISQHLHQDSTIDPRQTFDIQVFYFPHAVTAFMGGTRYLPGSHFRIVSEAAISRYQNIIGQEHVVCPAGTILLMHMGIWHGGGVNRSGQLRTLFKIRLCPAVRQQRLWDCTDLAPEHFTQQPTFWTRGGQRDPVQKVLMTQEPWFEADTGRLELMNRIRCWRFLLGDPQFDIDYWLTRVENEIS
jgi:hypothetical protein